MSRKKIGLILLLVFLSLASVVFFLNSFLFSPSKVRLHEGRVNILILGKAGPEHAGADLTDTMIVASVSLVKKPSVVLVSIPRDVWIAEIRAKINSAYYYGGVDLSRSMVEKVLGVPIQYSVVIDFSGFEKIIDALGGVDVYIERPFVDAKYPLAGREDDNCQGDPEYKCRYETLKFEEGWRHMDGETALKFVRSRNAEGDEGTDIAREARQQKVVGAIKDRVLSPQILLHPKKLVGAWHISKEFLKTDIDFYSAATLAKNIPRARQQISSYLVPGEMLFNPPASQKYDRQYVFVPVDGNWDAVHKWVGSIIKQ